MLFQLTRFLQVVTEVLRQVPYIRKFVGHIKQRVPHLKAGNLGDLAVKKVLKLSEINAFLNVLWPFLTYFGRAWGTFM